MAKPAGPTCNLACEYCYYLEKKNLYPKPPGTGMPEMSDGILEEYIRHAADPLHLAWRGGSYASAFVLQKCDAASE